MLRLASLFTALLLLATAGVATAFTAVGGGRFSQRATSATHATPATGRIEGNVIISTSLVARRARFRVYAERGVGAQPPAQPSEDERRNVVLFIDGVAPDSLTVPLAPRPRAAIHQSNERFVPHVLPVLRGTTIDFPNDDVVYHNVFSLSRAKTFDLGRFATGSSKSLTFSSPGTVQIFCHIHSDMSAVVLVLDSPWFGMPDEQGTYVIDDVPPGEYTLVGWHERIHPVTRRVRVRAGETTRVDFNIPLPVQAAER